MNSRMNIGNSAPETPQKPVSIGAGPTPGPSPAQVTTISGPQASVAQPQHTNSMVQSGGSGAGQMQMRPALVNNHGNISGKPGPAVLEAVKKVQEEAQRQSNQQSPGPTRFVNPAQLNQGGPNMGQSQMGATGAPQMNSGPMGSQMVSVGGTMGGAPQQQGPMMGQVPNSGQWVGQQQRFSNSGPMVGQPGQPGMQQGPRMGVPQMPQQGQGGQQPKPTKQSLDQLLLALKSPNSEEQVRKDVNSHIFIPQ